MYCKKCGNEIKQGQRFCTCCGTPVEPAAQPVSQSQPSQQAQPKQQEKPKTQSKPKVVQQPKKPENQTNRILLIIAGILAAIVLCLLVALLVKTQILDKKGFASDHDSWEEEDDEKDISNEEQDDEADPNASGETDDEQADADISAVELLQEKRQEILEKLGNADGSTFDVHWQSDYSSQYYGKIGVMGCIIQDISGDGVEDMVVVRADDDFKKTCADIYTIEDGEVQLKEQGLLMWEGMESDNSAGIVYLKKTADGWNLVADKADAYFHFADGASGTIVAYACRDHAYDTLTDYGYAGSDIGDEIPRIVAEGQKAGLDISDIDLGNLYAQQDKDVKGIAGYGLRVDERVISAGNWYDIAYDGMVYATINVEALTDEDGFADSTATREFLNTYRNNWESTLWSDADATDTDYVLPDSDKRKLTASDMEAIKGDAWLLRLARNELYARRGRIFDDETLQQYFESKSWYEPRYTKDEFREEWFTDIELYNRDLIKAYEAELN